MACLVHGVSQFKNAVQQINVLNPFALGLAQTLHSILGPNLVGDARPLRSALAVELPQYNVAIDNTQENPDEILQCLTQRIPSLANMTTTQSMGMVVENDVRLR